MLGNATNIPVGGTGTLDSKANYQYIEDEDVEEYYEQLHNKWKREQPPQHRMLLSFSLLCHISFKSYKLKRID